MNSISSYFTKAAWGVRYVGYFNTALICGAKMAHLVSNRFGCGDWFWHFSERRFDERLGVETLDMVPVEQLDIGEQQKLSAIRYEPTPFMEFGYVISRLPINHKDYSFIDVGSGKGRALLMATKFPFQEILGVEFSPELHEIAQGNLRHHCSQLDKQIECRSICEDATNFEFPNEPTVLFMFNPFKADILTQVIDNLRESHETNPRHIVVIYSNPLHQEVLDDSGFLTQTRSELNNWWVVYEAKIGKRLALNAT